jgi:uncharacterized membrane protein
LGIGKFLKIILAVQAAVVVLIVLAALGIDIRGIRQLAGFVYLTFVPGLLLLRILRVRNIGAVETLLYSVGLSITFVMFLGLFINVAYSYLGVTRPISILPLTATSAAVVSALCFVAWFRERRASPLQPELNGFTWREISSPPVLLLVLLPLVSVLGSYYLFNYYQNNALSMVFLLLVAGVAVLAGFNIFIPRRLYPLAVLSIAVSLLWHWSLVSQHVAGFDIHHEYYFQQLVLDGSFWDSSLVSNVNSMLSVVMLGPVYSLILDMDPVWVLKIIYPLFFSLLPLALFQIFRKQTDDRVSFFAVFFFVSFYEFYMGLPQLGRQEVAELFFILFVLLLLDSTMGDAKKKLLLVVFGLSIGVSHYGTGYFVLFYLVLSFLLVLLMKTRVLGGLWGKLTGKPNGNADNPATESNVAGQPASALTATLIATIIVLYFAWYMYIGAGSPLNAIVNVGVNTFDSLNELFFREGFASGQEPAVSMAIGLALPEIATWPRRLFLVIQYATQLFILAGVAWTLLNLRKYRFHPVYIAMTLLSGLLLVTCIVLPQFSKNYNISRIYHMTLLFLAPFCILGGVATIRWLSGLLNRKSARAPDRPVYLQILVVVVLVPYFLFYSSAFYIFTGDPVTSIALNPGLDYPRYSPQEVAAKGWLSAEMAGNYEIGVDWYGISWLVEPGFEHRTGVFWGDTEALPDDMYLFLRPINVKDGLVRKSPDELNTFVDLPVSKFGTEVLPRRSLVYSSGDTEIYR